MTAYILLIVLSAVFSFVSIRREAPELCIVRAGQGQLGTPGNLALPVFFLMLFAMAALKGESVGNDTANYAYFFDIYHDCSWQTVMDADLDVLYVLLNWLVGFVTDDFQVFLVIASALIVFPLARLYMEDRRYSFLKIVLFMNMPNFVLLFSGIRQYLAIVAGIWAYHMTRKKKPLGFALACVVALGIHHSGFMLLPMYGLYHANFKRRHLLFIVPAIGAVFVFNRQIFTVLLTFLARFSDKYSSEISSTGAITMLVLFALFAALCYIIPRESQMDAETLGLRNLLLFAVVLQCFAPLHTLSMRLNYYYILFIPMVVPKCLAQASPAYKQVAQLANVVMCLFFTGYYILCCYQALQTGGSLHTVPYIPFWCE